MSTSANFFIHPTADVQTVNIGSNSKVWQFTVILPGALIGNDCNINSHCFIENDVLIGHRVTVKCGVQIWDGVTIESDVHLGPNVAFTNDRFPRSKINYGQFEKTLIKSGASIGANATILCGITIGKNAMVGAGSVVTKNIPDNELWFGNPARFHSKAPPSVIDLMDKNMIGIR